MRPDDAWIHADDMLVLERQTDRDALFPQPPVAAASRCRSIVSRITVSHGPAYEIARLEEDARTAAGRAARTVTLQRLPAAPDVPGMWSGDLHVHMNYGGLYRNTPAHLAEQGRAEDLNLIYDLIVNKEQRFPDIGELPSRSRSGVDAMPVDPAWTGIPHQLLGTSQHPESDAAPAAARLRRVPFHRRGQPLSAQRRGRGYGPRQHALVGYAHPFDEDVDPGQRYR